MKKLLTMMILSAIFANADCEVLNYGPIEPSKPYSIVNSDAFQKNISGSYYASIEDMKNKKITTRPFKDQYLEFYNDTINEIKNKCNNNNYKGIYNLKINSSVNNDTYYFSAYVNYAK